MPTGRARKPKKKSTNKLSQSQTVIINRGGGGRGGKSKTTTSTTKSPTQQPINISHVTHVYNDRKTETKTEPSPTPTPTPSPSPSPAPSPFSGMFSTPLTSSPFPTTPAPSPFFGMSSPVLTPTPTPTTAPSPFSGMSSLPSDFSIRQESPPFASYGYGGMRRRQFPTGGGGQGATEPIIEEPEESTPAPPPPSSRFTRIEDITQPSIRISQQLPPFSNIPQFPSIPRNIFESMRQAETQQSVTQPLILPSEPMASMLQIEDEPPPPPMASMLQIEDAPPPPPPRKDLMDDAERVQQALLNEYSPPLKPSPPPPPPPVRQRGRPVEPISEEDINILDRYIRGLSIPSRNRTEAQKDDVLRGSQLKHNKRRHPDLVGILNGLREIYFPGK